MLKVLVVRLGWAAVMLAMLVVATFFLLRFAGDAAYFIAPPGSSEEYMAAERERLGLDDPLLVQFVNYVKDLAVGDLGRSYFTGDPVTATIVDRAPNTVVLAAYALVVIAIIGVPVGVFAAVWRGRAFDQAVRVFVSIGQSTPSFWFGFLLILALAVYVPIFPAGGQGTVLHLVLPVAALAIGPTSDLVRLVRTSMIEQLGSEYVKFHRIKGASEHVIRWKYGLRNAGSTTLTFLGLSLAKLFTGSVLVEVIFTWPGLGRLLVDSLQIRDLPVIQGIVLLFGAAFIVTNYLVDALYVVLNPRLRESV